MLDGSYHLKGETGKMSGIDWLPPKVQKILSQPTASVPETGECLGYGKNKS